MEMMNRAIEGAADFREMMQKLQRPVAPPVQARGTVPFTLIPPKPPKRSGENRAQYRARLRGMSITTDSQAVS